MIISATKLIATAFATEIMLLPGLPTENWLVSALSRTCQLC